MSIHIKWLHIIIIIFVVALNPLRANPRKWSNTLKQLKLKYFLGLVLKGLKLILLFHSVSFMSGL